MDTLPRHLDRDDWAIGSDGLLARRLGPWVKEKLHYIQRYIYIFNSGMKNKWRRRVYVDLFSGPGLVVVDDKEELLGSALLALRDEVGFTDLHFNDLEPLAIEALETRCQVTNASASVQFTNLDCNEAVRYVQARLPNDSLDLAFIDPTTWQLTFDALTQLTRGRKMDLIITFHVGGMKRAADFEPASLDAFFGTRLWRDAYRASLSEGKQEGSRILLDCYEEQLRKIGYEWIRDDIRITNRQHVGLYHLIFATKSERGEDFWQKVTAKSSAGQLRLFRETSPAYTA